MMIGYAMAALVAAGIFWAVVKPNGARFRLTDYSPRGIRMQFQIADGVPKMAGIGVFDSDCLAYVRPDPDVPHPYTVGHNLD